METAGANMLVNELSQGHERAMELEARLNQSSIELCKSLVHEILASYEKAISMAKASSACPNLAIACTDSSRSFAGSPFAGSPHSETSEQPFKTERKEMASKKRKAQPKWTSQVKLGSGPEAQGPLDDGHGWRKYGQKEILGAKHPRGYYRCTHRNSQGCLAMKQVQRSDDNPAIFEVTYRGTHTCHQKPSPLLAAAALSAFANPDHHSYNNDQHLLLSFQTNLKVKTENHDSKAQEPAAYTSFSFPSTPMDGLKPENHYQHHDVFSPSSMLDNCFQSSFNAAFYSPATSESNYFSASPCRMSSYGAAPSLQVSESDFTEIVSAATSAANSPIFEQLDFLLPSSTELDQDFLFDTSTFFS